VFVGCENNQRLRKSIDLHLRMRPVPVGLQAFGTFSKPLLGSNGGSEPDNSPR